MYIEGHHSSASIGHSLSMDEAIARALQEESDAEAARHVQGPASVSGGAGHRRRRLWGPRLLLSDFYCLRHLRESGQAQGAQCAAPASLRVNTPVLSRDCVARNVLQVSSCIGPRLGTITGITLFCSPDLLVTAVLLPCCPALMAMMLVPSVCSQWGRNSVR